MHIEGLILDNKDVKPEIGDIVLSSSAGFLNKLIRFVAGEPTHAEILVASIFAKGYTIGSGPFWFLLSNVRLAPIDRAPVYEIWRVADLPSAIRQNAASYAIEKVNAWYSYLLLPLLGYRIWAKALSTFKKDPFPNSFVCSELVAYAYSRATGETEPFGFPVINTLPKHILQNKRMIRIGYKK